MTNLYKMFFVVYLVTLTAFTLFLFFVDIAVGAAGHNADIKFSPWVCLITLVVGTLLRYPGDNFTVKKILTYIMMALIAISIAGVVYSLYDTFFICRCFKTGDNLMSALLILFMAISVVSFVGLIKDKL